MRPEDNSLENVSHVSRQWHNGLPSLTGADYRHTPHTFAHSPRPMLKSLLFQLEHEAPGLFWNIALPIRPRSLTPVTLTKRTSALAPGRRQERYW